MSDKIINNRIKSLLWRAGMMFLSGGIIALQGGLKELELGEIAFILSGLVLGEISKFLNSKK